MTSDKKKPLGTFSTLNPIGLGPGMKSLLEQKRQMERMFEQQRLLQEQTKMAEKIVGQLAPDQPPRPKGLGEHVRDAINPLWEKHTEMAKRQLESVNAILEVSLAVNQEVAQLKAEQVEYASSREAHKAQLRDDLAEQEKQRQFEREADRREQKKHRIITRCIAVAALIVSTGILVVNLLK